MNEQFKAKVKNFNKHADKAISDGYAIIAGEVWERVNNHEWRKVCDVVDYEI